MIGLEEADERGRFWECYQIIRKLGSGGDGTVYLVKHIVTEQLRAAKQIRTGKNGYHELQMMKRLHHPSLPEVIDVLEGDGGVWLILEYVRGEVIKHYAGKNLTPEIFFSFAEQLAEVVAYLHSRAYPILHLDIKPSNILVRKSGRIVLIDFGAAVHAGQTKTSEECRGTPGFAAPEQYQSNARLDGRTDVYGIGAVLFYLLSGNCYLPPETSDRKKRSEKQRSGGRSCFEKWKRKERAPFWRREAYRVVAACLEKEAGNRYSDCKILLEELRRSKKRWKRRQKVLPFMGALVLLLLLTCFGSAMWLREERKNGAEREITAEMLMESAKGLGLEAACEKYREVLQLKPEDTQVLFQALDQMLDDFQFTTEEEKNLQELLLMVPLHDETVQERLEEDPQQAGTFFYRLGLAYWYFYEGSGGRSAGTSWFQRAVRFGEEGEEADWLESARIYTELSAYYDSLGKREEKEDVYASLWTKLVQLWNSSGLERESMQVRTEAAEELLACIVMGAANLRENEKEVGEVLAELERFLGEEVQDADEKERFQGQLESAQTAWQRVTAFMGR